MKFASISQMSKKNYYLPIRPLIWESIIWCKLLADEPLLLGLRELIIRLCMPFTYNILRSTSFKVRFSKLVDEDCIKNSKPMLNKLF